MRRRRYATETERGVAADSVLPERSARAELALRLGRQRSRSDVRELIGFIIQLIGSAPSVSNFAS